MSAESDAAKRFLDGNACSQAVLSHYCELLDFDRSSAVKIASGFAAGMQMAKTCGAVTGAYMVLGLKFGTEDCDKPQERKPVYQAVTEFTRAFEKIHGVTDCRDLLGCDITTREGSEIAKQQKLFTTTCPGFVEDAVRILDSIIEKNYSVKV